MQAGAWGLGDLPQSRLVTVVKAVSATDVHRVTVALGGAGIPFLARNQTLQSLLGGSTYNPAFGPVEFAVPAEYEHAALAALADDYEVHPELVPTECPACLTPTAPGRLDCPHCGLFLA